MCQMSYVYVTCVLVICVFVTHKHAHTHTLSRSRSRSLSLSLSHTQTHTHTHTPLRTVEHHHKENRAPFSEVPHVCHTLQHTATHCNTLQHTATHCNFYKLLSIIMKGIELHLRLALSLSLCLSFFLSLPHKHTHTHTHTHSHTHTPLQTLEYHHEGSRAPSSTCSLGDCCPGAQSEEALQHQSSRPAASKTLRPVAVCRSVSQCVAACCKVLQCVTARCSVLQCNTLCYSVLHTASSCPIVRKRTRVCMHMCSSTCAGADESTPEHSRPPPLIPPTNNTPQTHSQTSSLLTTLHLPAQHTAKHCTTLHHIVTHCTTLYHT